MVRTGLLLVLGSALALAGEADQMREDIGSLQFLNRLHLSRAQALALLPIAERGAFLRREFDQTRDQLIVSLHDALVRFREEDLRNEGLSEAVTRAAGGTDHQLKLLGTRVATAMAPLEERAAAFLGPAQRKLALPRLTDRHPLDLLRSLCGSDFGELRDTLARNLANARVQQGLIPRHQRRAERLRIRARLHQLRRWSDEEYQAGREELLRALVPGRERDQAAAEIRRIYRARYGRAGPLASHLFRARMLPVLAERAGVAAPKLPPPAAGRTVAADLAEVHRRVSELKADINLLNLMNGLHLDVRQVEAIRDAAKKCHARALPAPRADDAKTRRALREVYAALRRDEPVPGGAAAQLQPEWVKRGPGYIRTRRQELRDLQAKGVERLMDALTAEQLEVIRTYSACLVPPKNLRDPVRAGQAADTGALERLLDRVRSLPLGTDPHPAADRLLASIEAYEGKIPADERPCKLYLLLGVAYEVQALDDVAYAARRTELAQRLAPLHRLDTLKERMMELNGADRVVRGKVTAFLLDPRIVPLAEDRIRRLKSPAAAKRPEIPKAERCEEGECGKP